MDFLRTVISSIISGLVCLYIGSRLRSWGKLIVKADHFAIFPYKAYQNRTGEYIEELVVVIPPPRAYFLVKLDLFNYSGIQKSIRSIDILFYQHDNQTIAFSKKISDELISVDPHNPKSFVSSKVRLDENETSLLFKHDITDYIIYLQYYEMEKKKSIQILKVTILAEDE